MHKTIFFTLTLFFLYFSTGVYVLSQKLPYYIFPKVNLKQINTNEVQQFSFYDASKNELLVREYGYSTAQCIVFFPGQHAGVNSYERNMFSDFVRNNFKVFSISYPGQDGAKGEVTTIASLTALITQAMLAISLQCEPASIVVYGRSLGGTIAAVSMSKLINKINVSGLILESVSPSLSVSIKNNLHDNWYLQALSLLPIAYLVPNDYKLNALLNSLNNIPVVIFQGDMDVKTPLHQLITPLNDSKNVNLIVIQSGGHSDTYIKAKNDIISAAHSMLKN
jgi:pimeloyl-ACP methyl ester carboxylesterase